MNTIDFSDCKQFVEGWHNRTKCISAAICLRGLHVAVGVCINYLWSWSGQKPSIGSQLQAAMDAADSNLIVMAYAKQRDVT